MNKVIAEKQIVTRLKRKQGRKNTVKAKVEVPQIKNSDLESKPFGIMLEGPSNFSTLNLENQEN